MAVGFPPYQLIMRCYRLNFGFHYGVPSYIINRIITAILHERTYVQWQKRRTNCYERSKGVKQGCPISPYIFILLLHYAISRVCARLNADLDLSEILLPMILAYADDIIVLGESIPSIELIFAALISELRDIGLTINEKKCSIMLRDPNQCESPLPPLVHLHGVFIYLRNYIVEVLLRTESSQHFDHSTRSYRSYAHIDYRYIRFYIYTTQS